MSGERINVSLDESVNKTLEDGTSVRVKRIHTQRPNPGSVAEHEAVHVVAAGEIVSADNIPNGNALGTTRPVRMTAYAAAAPASLGHSGTGWDQFLTERILGVDFEVAKRAARSVLVGKEEEIHEVATMIEEKSRITQTDVVAARKNIWERRRGIFPVEVTMHWSGTVYSYVTNSSHGEIVLPEVGQEKSESDMIKMIDTPSAFTSQVI